MRTAEPGEAIVCRACGSEIADRSALFTIRDGGVFVNPYGILYEVVTLRWAKNLVATGTPTAEFTWYPGYAWEIAYCGRCRAHLGWRFTAADDREPRAFWGLRRDALAGAGL